MRLTKYAGFNQRLQGWSVLGWMVVMLVGVGGFVRAAEDGVLRSRSYKFRYITSQQAREFLSQLKIGTELDILTDTSLIVTSDKGGDLTRATQTLTLLDRKEPTVIRVLNADPKAPLPTPEVLAEQLTGMTAGTMADAPPKGSPSPVIVDTLAGKLIAIGSEALLNEIETALKTWQKENTPAEPVVDAPDPEITDPTVDEPAQPEEPTAVEPKPEPVAEKLADEKLVPVREVTAEKPAEKPEAETPVEETPETPAAEPKDAAADLMPDKSFEQIVNELMAAQQADERAAEAEEKQTPPVDPLTTTEDVAVEDVTPKAADTEAADDFLSDALLQTLKEEEAKKAQQLAAQKAAEEKAAADKKEVAEKAAKTAEDKPAMSAAARQRAEAIAAMKKQAEADESAAKAAEAAANDELKKALEMLLKSSEPAVPEKPAAKPAEPTPAREIPTPKSKQSQLEQELAELRAQIAELKAAKAAAITETQTPETEPAEETVKTGQAAFEEAVGEEMLDTVIDLPQEVMLESLIDLVGKQLGLNYMYDPALLKNQKVTLKIHKGQIKVRDLYALMESTLYFKGFIMSRRDNLVTIMKSTDVAKIDPVFRNADDPIDPGAVVVSTIFELENIGADDAKKTLDGMKLSSIANGIQTVAGTNRLIVTDYAYRMERIAEAIEMIDVAGEPKEFESRQLKYMQAAELVEKLKILIKEMEGVSLEVAAPAATPKTRTVRTRDPRTGRTIEKQVPVTTSTASAAKPAQKDAVYIDIDERTNRVLMIGKPADLKTLNDLIDTLDVPQQDLKMVREYVIQHVEAIEVVNVLNELGLAAVSVSTPQQTTTAARTTTTRDPRTGKTVTTPAPRPTPSTAAKTTGAEPSISIRPATNSLLVNASEEQHRAIELVIAHVDVVQKDQRTIREYEIQNVDAQEIIDTMTDLGMIASQSTASRSTTAGRSTTSSRSTPQTVAGESAPTMDLAGLTGESGSITEDQPQISILEATNSLLVYATPRQHKAIALLIAHADRTQISINTPYVVYALENQDPLELAEVLNKLIKETVDETVQKSSAGAKVQPKSSTSPTSSTALALEEERIRVIPDEKSYSLIVYANKRNQQWISELIKELDEYRPQVLLDCTLVNVSSTDKFNYDLNIISSYPDLTNTSGLTGTISGTGADAITKDNILSKLLDPSSDRDRYIDFQADSGSFTGFYGDDKVMALLTAMQTKNYGRVMARPKILVNDNEEGSITSDEKTYREVTETSYVGTENPQPTETKRFDPYTAGLTLTIKPHISKGDQLQLTVSLVRSSFKDTPQSLREDDPAPKDELKTEVTSVVTVPDNSTIILGGLDTLDQSKGGQKVPLLGDLPLIGGLFREISNNDLQSKLYVFVKAHILRPGEDNVTLKRVFNEEKQKFETLEKQMQEYQDWPGIDPKPMEPVKVLEEDFQEDN